MAADHLRDLAGRLVRLGRYLRHRLRLRANALLFMLSVAAGFALALQMRTQEAAGRLAQRAPDIGQAMLIDELLRTNAALHRELLALQQARGQGQHSAGNDQAQALLQELAILRAVNGRVELLGSGVEVEIAAAVAPEDLHDLFNDLRAAGAEALALNEHRVLAAGAVAGEPDALRFNGALLTRPYNVRAIGPVAALERALTRPGGMVALLRQNYPGARINVIRRDRIRIPAATAGAPRFTYARPAE